MVGIGDLVNMGGVGSINYTTVLLIVIVASILIVLLIGGVVAWWVLSYSMLAIIEEKLEHGTQITTRRAKIQFDKKDKGNPIERIRLFLQKGSWSIMPPSYIVEELRAKGNDPTVWRGWFKSLYGITKRGKKAIRLIKEGNEFTVVPWSNEKALEYLRESKPVRKQWANNSFREGMEIFKDEPSWLQKYGGMVTMMGAMITVMIIFIFLFNKLDNLTAHAEALRYYADAILELSQTARAVGVQNIGG